MKKRIVISIFLIFVLLLSAFAVHAENANNEPEYYTFEDGVGKDEIPYGETASVGTSYGYSNFRMMNEAQARAAGVPEGYSGYVLALDPKGSSSIGIGIDLTDINVKDIESISFRIWCPVGTKQDGKDGGVRLSGNGPTSWNMLVSPSAIGEWIDIVFEKDDFSSFDYDGDGYCNPTNFCLRHAAGTAYIDHITVNLKAPDTTAPVISYEGETVIKTTAGKAFYIDASALDDRDGYVEPEYIFSDGAIDENGLLLEGEHTCTVRFTDAAGNSSEIVIDLTVDPRDVTAPVLDWAPDKIFAEAGMMPRLTLTATDDRDGEIKAESSWSNGAIIWGRLVVGEHTLTVTATDSSGNKTEKTITVVVINP